MKTNKMGVRQLTYAETRDRLRRGEDTLRIIRGYSLTSAFDSDGAEVPNRTMLYLRRDGLITWNSAGRIIYDENNRD